ncbi:hypothetical protein Fcan01_27413 [Folsomia candida]|uniref:Uncharacterized protein n=1 Tax=Folsomia candida TaxID=158441 RepID=A0A226D0G3_FOLCA|nr:hypothetical protein Fcan01_27413 [Folsomia candida]
MTPTHIVDELKKYRIYKKNLQNQEWRRKNKHCNKFGSTTTSQPGLPQNPDYPDHPDYPQNPGKTPGYGFSLAKPRGFPYPAPNDCPIKLRKPTLLRKIARAVKIENFPTQNQLSKKHKVSQPTIHPSIKENLNLKVYKKTRFNALKPPHKQIQKSTCRRLYRDDLAGKNLNLPLHWTKHYSLSRIAKGIVEFAIQNQK